MENFFKYDPQTAGSKGLIFIGDKILVYRRDDKTDKFPLCIDLPGGGPEKGETPFENFKREIEEEFGLIINASDVTYVRRYPSMVHSGKVGYFPVAQLPEEAKDQIRFGDEGLEYLIISVNEYLHSNEIAWPFLKEWVKDYLKYKAED